MTRADDPLSRRIQRREFLLALEEKDAFCARRHATIITAMGQDYKPHSGLVQSKALTQRYMQAVDANATSDWSVIDEYVAEDFEARNPPLPGVGLDRDGMKEAAEIFRLATPGSHEITMAPAHVNAAPTLSKRSHQPVSEALRLVPAVLSKSGRALLYVDTSAIGRIALAEPDAGAIRMTLDVTRSPLF